MFYHPGKGPLDSKISFSCNFIALGLCRGGIQDQVINFHCDIGMLGIYQ